MRTVFVLVGVAIAVFYHGFVAADNGGGDAAETLPESDQCLGVPKPEETPCFTCHNCVAGVWNCSVVDCSENQCKNGFYNRGECCMVCADGPNCSVEGKIIKYGTTVTLTDGRTCRCAKDVDNAKMMTMCTPPR